MVGDHGQVKQMHSSLGNAAMRFLICLAFVACNVPYKAYILKDGSQVHCKQFLVQECGVYLWKCTTGKEYFCQSNVETNDSKDIRIKDVNPSALQI